MIAAATMVTFSTLASPAMYSRTIMSRIFVQNAVSRETRHGADLQAIPPFQLSR